MDIKSPREFEKIFNDILENVINDLTKKIEKKLHENIQQYTYDYDPEPNQWYRRTGEFLESFYRTLAQKTARNIIGTVIHDPMKMSAPIGTGIDSDISQESYQHGNFFKGYDRRKILADLLDVDGINSGADFRGKERKPFFTLTIKWLDDNWFYLIDSSFKKFGITNWERR